MGSSGSVVYVWVWCMYASTHVGLEGSIDVFGHAIRFDSEHTSARYLCNSGLAA